MKGRTAPYPLLVALLLPVHADAAPSPIQYQRPSETRILLTAKKCDPLSTVADALTQWNTRRGGQIARHIQLSKQPDNTGCAIEIDVAPGTLLADQLPANGEPPYFGSQNCWNLAFNAADLLQRSYRFSSHQEFTHATRLFCTPRAGSPLAGDVIAVRNRKTGDEVHGFLFISDDLSLSKNGVGAQAVLKPARETLRGYDVKAGCEFVSEETLKRSKCVNYAVALDCDGAALASPPAQASGFWSQLEAEERTLMEMLDWLARIDENTTEREFNAAFDAKNAPIQGRLDAILWAAKERQTLIAAQGTASDNTWLQLVEAKASAMGFQARLLRKRFR